MRRVIVYVDGFNLYYGLRERRWRRYYWLNLRALSRALLKPDQSLMHTHYFTSVVSQPEDKRLRQQCYLDALLTLPDFTIHYGHYLDERVTCRNCGYSYTTHHEKMTDVNIAVRLLTDSLQDRFDVALLVSADSDLVAPIRAVRELSPEKRVIVAFPPARHSVALQNAAHGFLHVGQDKLRLSQFDDTVVTDTGVELTRPDSWR